MLNSDLRRSYFEIKIGEQFLKIFKNLALIKKILNSKTHNNSWLKYVSNLDDNMCKLKN